jgi:hypothetical protein
MLSHKYKHVVKFVIRQHFYILFTYVEIQEDLQLPSASDIFNYIIYTQ